MDVCVDSWSQARAVIFWDDVLVLGSFADMAEQSRPVEPFQLISQCVVQGKTDARVHVMKQYSIAVQQ